ncbi:MAG: tRNA pseudouridine(55) synthase TruB [Thermodesulfobacteriota bacterium]
MGSTLDGILLVDKQEGESSFSVVRRVRRALKAGKAGHAGTLDPFATGLLVILIGQGTKLFPYVASEDKEYRATLTLGVETDTLDLTGRVVRTAPVPEIEPGFVREKAKDLEGEIEQSPPDYSAVHHEGKRAYELARKGVPLELAKRRVKIHRLEVVSVDLPEVTLTLKCSKGTYVRSLAAELGRRLGPGGHLKALRRLSSGSFRVEDAVSLGGPDGGPEDLGSRVIPLRSALPHVREAAVSCETARMIGRGIQAVVRSREFLAELPACFEGPVKLITENRMVALLRVVRRPALEESRFEIMRVFARE